MDTISQAGATETYIICDDIEAYRPLGTVPNYHCIVANDIATQSETLSYTHIASQLRELINKRKLQKTNIYTPTATVSADIEKICNYCNNVKR